MAYNLLMNSKSIVWLGLFVGSFIGGLLPSLWGADTFSFSGVILSAVGGLLGIYAGFRISR
jgi:hypothetical protein